MLTKKCKNVEPVVVSVYSERNIINSSSTVYYSY